MTKGAVQVPVALSYAGTSPVGCDGPSKPGVSAKLDLSSSARDGFLAMAFKVSVRLAIVPPDAPPAILRTRPLTRGAGWPWRRTASACKNRTPRSNGIESNPQLNVMRAPEALAAASCSSIISRIQPGILGRTDQRANLGQLVGAAPRHRPFWRIGAASIMGCQIFCHEAAGKAGCAIDDDVELARFCHDHPPFK